MADDRIMVFEQLLDKTLTEGSPEFLRDGLKLLATKLMELEVKALAGAEKGERTEGRKDYRNGFRNRRWDTRVGTLELEVPKLRKTPYVPCFLETRRRGERALVNVVQEAYVTGVSTRKVERILQAMGLDGISKSEVSRISMELEALVQEFRSRPLEGNYPYLWLDARYEKVRIGSRVVSNAVVVAYAVHDSGVREVIGVDVVQTESEPVWTEFLRSLAKRGLSGVQLVISDAHTGLKKAIQKVFTGATWQRCRVHFMRNMLSLVPKKVQPWLSAALRTIFSQLNQGAAHAELAKVVEALSRHHKRAAELLESAAHDVLAFMAFPRQHWRQIHSTNPLERLNREIRRRTAVVGIFPNQVSLLRLVGMLLIEQNDEWAIGRRYFSQQSMAALYETPEKVEGLLTDGADLAA